MRELVDNLDKRKHYLTLHTLLLILLCNKTCQSLWSWVAFKKYVMFFLAFLKVLESKPPPPTLFV